MVDVFQYISIVKDKESAMLEEKRKHKMCMSLSVNGCF